MANRIKNTETEMGEEAVISEEVTMDSVSASTSHKGDKKGFGMVTKLLVLVLLLSAVTTGYLYSQVRTLSQDPSVANQAKIQEAVDRVGMLMVLPEGEVPTLATINDKSKLEGQPFFANAKVGDQVLLYPGAKKAILFDPVANIIIDVSSINLGQ